MLFYCVTLRVPLQLAQLLATILNPLRDLMLQRVPASHELA